MSWKESIQAKPVCVTGASGFLGAQVVQVLLNHGFEVRGTVRDLSKPEKIQHLNQLPGSDRLTLYTADLLVKGSFDDAFQGCSGIIHTASPFFLTNPSEDSLTKPALEGTENVLTTAAKFPEIKRVVVTSSTAAVYADFGKYSADHVYTEEDWSDAPKLREKQHWYALGKTLAEKFVFEFVEKLGMEATFDVVTLNPTWILGPMLQPSLNESSKKISDYISGVTKIIPNQAKTYVDVRDVAEAHVAAYETKNAKGRYLLIGSCNYEAEVCDALRKLCPTNSIPTEVSTDIVAPVYGPQQPALLEYCCRKAQDGLGIQFKSFQEMLEATVDSLRQHSYIS